MWQDGEEVICQGAHGHCMFIVIKGGAFVRKEGHAYLEYSYASGDFFGELALVSTPTPGQPTSSQSTSTPSPAPRLFVACGSGAHYTVSWSHL